VCYFYDLTEGLSIKPTFFPEKNALYDLLLWFKSTSSRAHTRETKEERERINKNETLCDNREEKQENRTNEEASSNRVHIRLERKSHAQTPLYLFSTFHKYMRRKKRPWYILMSFIIKELIFMHIQ
jgi:hypothetical protein